MKTERVRHVTWLLRARVILFGPGSPPWVSEALRREAMEKIQPAMKLFEEAGLSATCGIEEGTPAGVILKVARRYAADLIVLTLPKRSRWSRWLSGPSDAEQVNQQADCEVTIAPPSDA